MALEVGSVFAKLGARFDDDGFDRWERRLHGARRDAANDVETQLKGDFDRRGFDQFDRASSSADRSSGRVRRGMGLMGGAMLSAGAAAGGGLAYGLYKGVTAAADFEQKLSALEAATGATGAQMDRLRDQAIKAGAATKFSADDAAQAQTELAKGGLQLEDILSGGLDAALGLAAAGELELADAASYTANAMNLFGLNGKEATHVADALATAANATTADVSDFGMALTQGGAAAKAAGLSFDETVAALEALAASGTKGSDAGTSLKAALTQIAKPTAESAATMKELGINFFDAQGNMKPLVEISGMLGDKLSGLTREQRLQAVTTIAGTDGMRALLSLYDAGPQKVAKWQKGLAEEGSAAEVAAKKQDNFKGALENLQGSVETLAIVGGSALLPFLTDATQGVTEFLAELQTGEGAGGAFKNVLAGIGDAIGSVVDGIAGFVEDNRDVFESIGRNVSTVAGMIGRAAGNIFDAFKDVFGSGSGIGDDISAIGRVILQIADAGQKVYIAIARRTLPAIEGAFRGFFQVIRGVIRVISGILTGDFGKAWDGVKDIFVGGLRLIFNAFRGVTAPFRTVAAAIGKVIAAPFKLAWDVVASGARLMGRIVEGVFNGVRSVVRFVIGKILDGIDFFLGGLEAMARAAGKLPIIGDKFDGVADAIHGVRERLKGAKTELDGLPGKAVKVQPLINRFKELGLKISDARWFAQRFKSALEDINSVPKLRPLDSFAPQGDPRTLAEQVLAQLYPPSVGGRVTGTFKYANQVASMFGLHVTSSYRTPEHNAEVNGVPNSMHTHGTVANPGAIDLVGPTSAMYAAAGWARQHLPVKEVLVHDAGSGLHLHLGFFQQGGVPGGKVGPTAGGPRIFIAGEGNADEWVISQEGDRRKNVRWAREALETLTGRDVALYAGGKGGAIKKMKGRASGLGEVIAAREGAIEQRERYYSRLDRKFGLDQEEFLTEDADGNLVINQGAIDERVSELDELWKTRKQIRGMVFRLRKALLNAQSVLNRLVDKLRRVIRRARGAVSKASGKKGKKRAQEHYDNVRRRYGPKIDEYSSLSEDYKSRSLSAWNDWKDMQVDLDEIAAERSEVAGTTAPGEPAAEPDTFGPDYLTGDQDTTLGGLLEAQALAGTTPETDDDELARAGLEAFWRGVLKGDLSQAERIDALGQLAGFLPRTDDATGGEGGDSTAPPSLEDIARAAMAQFSGFQSARQDLFSSFGSNILGYGSSPTSVEAALAAGARYFGAVPGSSPGETVGRTVTQEITFTAPTPPNPHIFAQATLHEMEAAL